MFLRFLRRRSSLETTVSEFRDTEFRSWEGEPDLRPSVYELDSDPQMIVRTAAEHAANAGLRPQGGVRVGVDVSGLFTEIRNDDAGEWYFDFIRSAHRELMLDEMSRLEELLTSVQEDAAVRLKEAPSIQIRTYVHTRLVSSDEEWENFCEVAPHGQKWRSWASQHAPAK